MSEAIRLSTKLVMAFDAAQGAWDLDRLPGWPAASEDLRKAIDRARALGDVSGLPCPLAWWTSALAQARCWLEAPADVRRGLTPHVVSTIRALEKFNTGKIAVSVDVRGGVR